MATEFARVTNTGSYPGRLTWIGRYDILDQNPITNKTKFRLYGVMQNNNDSPSTYPYNAYGCDYEVAGTKLNDDDYMGFPRYQTTVGYTDREVTHNPDGTFPSTSFSIYAKNNLHFNPASSASGYVSAPALDRATPTIALSLASRTASSLNISVTASAVCDTWEYTLDDGSTWTQFSTTEATSVTLTLTGLTPSGSYTVKVRARKKVNHLTGISSASTYTTLGAAIINSATEIYADASTVALSASCEVYNASYTYSLAIKNGADTYLTITGIPAMAVGTRTINITLDSTQKANLLSAMANVASFSATYVLTSYNNSTEIGSSTTSANILTSASASGPGSPTFTYKDNNSAAVTVTGDDQTLIQGQSSLRLLSLTATAKNGASIASYNITIGDATKVSTSGGTVDVGTVGQSGTLALTVTAKDTRGYTSSSSVNVTVYPYSAPSLSTGTVSRDLIAATEIALNFSGTFTNLGTNTVTAKYRYKKTADSTYSAYTNISPTVSGSGFSYSASHIEDFDADYSYNFELVVSDKLVSETYAWTVIQYKPLIAYRDGQIGINKVPRAGYAVDIEGTVAIDDAEIGGVAVPDPNEADSVLGMNSGGTALEWKTLTIPAVPADYVVEQGTSNGWTYRKWDSGIAECWGRMSGTITAWNSWGGIRESNSFSFAYPTGLFNAEPTLLATPHASSVGTFGPETFNAGTKDNTPSLYAVRPDSGGTGVTIYFNLHAYGTWK